jgi:hypothetical protein
MMDKDCSGQAAHAVAGQVERPVGRLETERAKVEALMKRLQIGAGGRTALDNAHDIMAECYGTILALMLDVDALQTRIDSLTAGNRQREAELRTYMRR